MDSFFIRFKNPLVLVAVVLLQTIGLAVQVQRAAGPAGDPADGGKISQLRYWSTLLVTPFERALHGSGSEVRKVWTNYIDLRHTRQQNRDLQNEIARLREEQAAFAEDAEQGLAWCKGAAGVSASVHCVNGGSAGGGHQRVRSGRGYC